jgi:hypothetical protein
MEASGNAPAACSAPIDPGCAVGLRQPAERASPRKIRYSSDSPGPPSLHSRFGDGLDGRRQIGSTPAAGDVGSADTPRAPRQAPPTNEPDEPSGPVLGERMLLFPAGGREILPDAWSLYYSSPLTPPDQRAPARGAVTAATSLPRRGAYSSAATTVSSTRLRFVAHRNHSLIRNATPVSCDTCLGALGTSPSRPGFRVSHST